MDLLTVRFSNVNNNAPRIEERLYGRKDYVFFDTDNLFPQRMVELADNSPIHGAAINKHSFFIAGNGIEFESESDSRADQALNWLEGVTDGLDKFITALSLDRAYFTGHCVAVQHTVAGDILKVKHQDFSTVRAGRTLMPDIWESTEYWFSIDWKKATFKLKWDDQDFVQPKEYVNYFNPKRRKSATAFIYDKGYKPGKLYYPEPDYLGALKYVKTEIKLSQYVDRLTTNGFRAGTHIHLFKELDDEAAKKAETKINDKFANDEAPDIVLTYGGDPSSAPTVNNLPAFTNAEILTTVGKELQKQIDTAHVIPSMLYTSFETSTGLDGQATAIREVLEYYQNSGVRPEQKRIEQTLDTLLAAGGFEDVKTHIKAVNPVNFMVEKDIMMAALERNEIRKEIGWPDLEDDRGKVIINNGSNGVQRQDETGNAD